MHVELREAVEKWFAAWNGLYRSDLGITTPVVQRVQLFEEYLRSWSCVVGVFGSLKVGKSTLLNALIGRRDLLKTHRAEATSAMTAIRMLRSSNIGESGENVLIVFAHSSTFELLCESGLALEDLQEALRLLRQRTLDAAISAVTLFHGAEEVVATRPDLSPVVVQLEAHENAWLKSLSGASARPVLPRRLRLNVRFAPREPLVVPLDEEHLPRIHAFMSATESCAHRTVARVVVRLKTGGGLNRDFELIDLPGRASRNAWRNQLSGLVADHALDERWVIKWSTQDVASTSEFERAVDEAPKQRWLPQLYLVSQMDSALESFARDQQQSRTSVSFSSHDIFKEWCRRTWGRYLLRSVTHGDRARARVLADRCIFLSAIENRADRLDLPGHQQVDNPVRGGLEVLLLATAHDQALRHDGEYVAARARLIRHLTTLIERECQPLLQSFEMEVEENFEARFKEITEYKTGASRSLGRMRDALADLAQSAQEKEEHLEEMSQESLRLWGERDFESYMGERRREVVGRLNRAATGLKALRQRLLDPADLDVVRALDDLSGVASSDLDGSEIVDALSGIFTKIVDALNIFRLFSSNASLQEKHRKEASCKARGLLRSAIRALASSCEEWIEQQEASNNDLLEVVEQRVNYLRRKAEEAKNQRRWRQKQAALMRARLRELQQASAGLEHIQHAAEGVQERVRRLADELFTTTTTGADVKVTLQAHASGEAPTEWSQQATPLATELGLWVLEVPRMLQRDAGKWARLSRISVKVSSRGAMTRHLGLVWRHTESSGYLREVVAPDGVHLPLWGKRPMLLIDLKNLCISVVPRPVAQRWSTYRREMAQAIDWTPEAARPQPSVGGGHSILKMLKQSAAAIGSALREPAERSPKLPPSSPAEGARIPSARRKTKRKGTGR